jgi:hypothetical protein
MNKILLLLFTAFIILFSITGNAQNNRTTSAAGLNGAWISVDNKSFYMYSDKFFSDIAQDSTGIWRSTHAGSYTVVNSNTITHKILYSSYPDHIGALHTLEYEINGDTLTMKWFKKLIDAKGVDITVQLPKGQQAKYVRAE